MHQEIERKYLLTGDDYQRLATRVYRIRQGYICREKARTVRIRQRDAEAFLTIKGGSATLAHFEYEQPVPPSAVEGLFALCLPGIIEKERYIVPWQDVVIEVDVFHGAHEGLVLAEIELQSEEQQVMLPSWIGEEVTGDVRYYNAYLSGQTERYSQ